MDPVLQGKSAFVKNKTPASIQITAEQILREAKDHQEGFRKVPKQQIVDEEELRAFQGTKRKQFEDALRKDRTNISAYVKYATWEESQNEMERYVFIILLFLSSTKKINLIFLKKGPVLFMKEDSM
jgi:hypothetical protein